LDSRQKGGGPSQILYIFVVKYIKIIQERTLEEYRFRIHAENSDCRKIR